MLYFAIYKEALIKKKNFKLKYLNSISFTVITNQY